MPSFGKPSFVRPFSQGPVRSDRATSTTVLQSARDARIVVATLGVLCDTQSILNPPLTVTPKRPIATFRVTARFKSLASLQFMQSPSLLSHHKLQIIDPQMHHVTEQ